MRPLLPMLGITRVADVTGLDVIGLPVVMVVRPNAKSLSVAQGKGLTREAARASGIMEAIESWHAENILRPLKLASWSQMATHHRLIDLGNLPGYAGARFHPDDRTLWIEGHDLGDGGPRWLPFASVHTDFTLPLPPGSGTFFMGSNGLASGNHPVEALCHALCELVERDAVTLWRARGGMRLLHTRLDLDSVDDPACRAVLDRCARAGVDVHAWDATSDAGIATFHAVIAERRSGLHRPLGPMGGMGCHPAREVALLRALTEAAQSRLTLIAGARDDMHGQRRDEDARRRAHEELAEAARAPGPRRRFDEVATRAHAFFEDDLRFLVERLRAIGCPQIIAVDLARPEIGVPVVRAVVPGLEILDDAPGYAPGRRARAVTREAVAP